MSTEQPNPGAVPLAATLVGSVNYTVPTVQISSQLASVVTQWSQKIPLQDLTIDRLLMAAPRMAIGTALVPVLGGIPLLSKLGQGGMGAVYFGIHPRLEKEVAVKVLPFQLHDSQPGIVSRFYREAQLAAKIESPHLVSVKDVNEDHGLFYLVMEFVQGQSAGAYLRAIRQKGLLVEEALALEICIATCEGLAAAHTRGVIHRDIKPDNIMLPKSEQDDRLVLNAAKLADLGLARMDDSGQSLTGTQNAIGTPGYMPPEQAFDARKAGKTADVYSLGATLYAFLCGQPPQTGSTPMEAILNTMQKPHAPVATFRPDVTPVTVALLERCLNKEPSARYVDGPALLKALRVARAALGEPETTQRRAIEELTLLQKASEVGAPVPAPSALPVDTSASTLVGNPAQLAAAGATAVANHAPAPQVSVAVHSSPPASNSATGWLGLVAALLVVGLLAVVVLLVLNRGGGGASAPSGVTYITSTNFSGNLYFADAGTILKEYEKSKGEPLKDPAVIQALEKATAFVKAGQYAAGIPALEEASKAVPAPAILNNLGALYMAAQKPEEARKAYARALQQNPQYQPAHLNLGLLEQANGQLAEAAASFAQATDLREASTQAEQLKKELSADVKTREIEPNNDAFSATPIPLNRIISGQISAAEDQDYFTFKSLPNVRDMVKISVQNKSTSLAVTVQVYGPQRELLCNESQNTPGADESLQFACQPDTQYFVRVASHYPAFSGAYTLQVSPLLQYDKYEPNDDILNAKPVDLDTDISANILDAADTDCVKFTAPAGKKISVALENKSNSLSPTIHVFDAAKALITTRNENTPGGNLQFIMEVAPGTPFYVKVAGHYPGLSGAYVLKVSPAK